MSTTVTPGPRSRGERIPLDAVMPHVQKWIDAWYSADDALGLDAGYVDLVALKAAHPEWATSNESLAVCVLADRSGLTPSAIGRWLRDWKAGRSRFGIGYFDADRLITALDAVLVWFTDPWLAALRQDALDNTPEVRATVCTDNDGRTE